MIINPAFEYTEEQLCLIYGLTSVDDIQRFIKKLLRNKVIDYDTDIRSYYLTDEQLKTFFETDCAKPKLNLEQCAEEMMNLYPKGRKPNTSKSWRGNLMENTRKLKRLMQLTNGELELDLVIQATKKYIESFNGNYDYMRTLPYFILKTERVEGEFEFHSDLLSTIENIKNPNSENTSTQNDWVTNLI